jgi:hypothetical protein
MSFEEGNKGQTKGICNKLNIIMAENLSNFEKEMSIQV